MQHCFLKVMMGIDLFSEKSGFAQILISLNHKFWGTYSYLLHFPLKVLSIFNKTGTS